jgi:hypothetical protein
LTEVIKVKDVFMFAMPRRALKVRLVLSLTISARRCDCPSWVGCQPDRSAPQPFPCRRRLGTARVPTSARLGVLHPVATRRLLVQLRCPNRSIQGAVSQHPAPSASIRPRNAPGGGQTYPNHCPPVPSFQDVHPLCWQGVRKEGIPRLAVPVGIGGRARSRFRPTTQHLLQVGLRLTYCVVL